MTNPQRNGLPSPYYEDEAVTIYHGDCREFLPRIEADIVACALAGDSLPEGGDHA